MRSRSSGAVSPRCRLALSRTPSPPAGSHCRRKTARAPASWRKATSCVGRSTAGSARASPARDAREGRLRGPALEIERLVSKDYTHAEKSLASSYAAGDVVAFRAPDKGLGIKSGDVRRVVGVDHKARAVLLQGREGGILAWNLARTSARLGDTEVYRAEGLELRAGDRICWTRNDSGLGVIASRTAEVLAIESGRVTFRLADGQKLELGRGDPQLRHLDHAWASSAHAFRGRTSGNVIAAMEARQTDLTTQTPAYAEIGRVRSRAELITDDAGELRARLQAATGERIPALDALVGMRHRAQERAAERVREDSGPHGGRAPTGAGRESENSASPPMDRNLSAPEHDRGAGMDLGL